MKVKGNCKMAFAGPGRVRMRHLCKKITARPRKNLAVGVKLMYDQKH